VTTLTIVSFSVENEKGGGCGESMTFYCNSKSNSGMGKIQLRRFYVGFISELAEETVFSLLFVSFPFNVNLFS
jgi:hypothetical protein